MSRFVSHMFAFGLVAVVWVSLAPQSSHGQINFAPPRGANAISPTMSTLDRPAAQAPKAKAVTAHRETTRQDSERRQITPAAFAASSDAAPLHQMAPTSNGVSSHASADFSSGTNRAVSPARYTSTLYPAYLRSLNVRDEDPESPPYAEAMQSSDGAGPHTASSPSPPRTDYIRVSSYRVGQTL